MSRSKRKSPVIGMTTARSEKEDKRWHHRVLRRRVREGRGQGRSCLTAFLDNKEVKQERPLILTLEL